MEKYVLTAIQAVLILQGTRLPRCNNSCGSVHGGPGKEVIRVSEGGTTDQRVKLHDDRIKKMVTFRISR